MRPARAIAVPTAEAEGLLSDARVAAVRYAAVGWMSSRASALNGYSALRRSPNLPSVRGVGTRPEPCWADNLRVLVIAAAFFAFCLSQTLCWSYDSLRRHGQAPGESSTCYCFRQGGP
jgi:hypothetical protein